MVVNRPTTVTKSGTIHLPVIDNNAPKILIYVTDNDGVEHLVCDTVNGSSANNWTIDCKITRPVTTKLGSFVLRLANTGGHWLDSFNGGESVRIYADYNDASTLIFKGKIDDPKYGVNANIGFYIDLDGRDYPELVDTTITNLHVAALASEAICDIFYDAYTDITLTFWNGSVWAEATYDFASGSVSWSDTVTTFPETRINMQYQHKKGWSIISEILERSGLDGYMWYDEDTSKWTLRTFLLDDVENLNVNVAYGINLVSANEYGFDNANVFNRVFVYGKKESDNIILLKMSQDTDSQSDLWVKDYIVSAPELSNMSEVDDKATFELGKNATQTNTGRFTAVGTPLVNPGEQVAISIPYCGCTGLHTVKQVTHSINTTFLTTLEVSKNLQTVPSVFKSKANPDDFAQGTTNLNSMTDSYTVFFEPDDEGYVNHTNTEIVDGKLRLVAGAVAGEAVVATKNLSYDVRKCEFRRFENYETDDDRYYVTNDGGANWEEYDPSTGLLHNFATAGNQIAWKISMERYSSASPTPAYEAVCMLVKP